MGSSLSNCLDMAVTMKSAVRVDMNSASLELADFPDEIILKVCASLDLKDLLNCGQVSKRFRRISHDEFLWQRIDLSRQNVSAAFIQFILDRGCKYLDLSNCHILDLKSIENIFINCIQSTELNLEYTNISLKSSSFSIESKVNIGIFYNEDPDEYIRILLERCNQLKEFQLKYYVPFADIATTSIVEGLKHFHYFDTLDLTLYSHEKISCSNLLHLPGITKITNLNIIRNKDITRLRTELKSLNFYIKEYLTRSPPNYASSLR